MISINFVIVMVVSLFSLAVVVHGDAPTEPATMSSYISYTEGNSNLIITVPHGGSLQPASIQSRTACPGVNVFKGCLMADNTCEFSHDNVYGNCRCDDPDSDKCGVRFITDSQTVGVANELRDQIEFLSGKKPHVIISNLQRRKLDANRAKDIATFGDVTSGEAWETYHYYIAKAKYDIEQGSLVNGLLLDIHGQSHPEEWTEMGYALTQNDLNLNKYTKKNRDRKVTICALVRRECLNERKPKNCFRNLVRKGKSLGERLAQKTDSNGVKYDVIPSKRYPRKQASGYSYFEGAYTVRRHGSMGCAKTGSTVDSIQVEAPAGVRKGATPAERLRYSNALGSVVVDFMRDYYGW